MALMFYLFHNALNIFYLWIWLRTTDLMRFLHTLSHRQGSAYHGLSHTIYGALTGMSNSSKGSHEGSI